MPAEWMRELNEAQRAAVTHPGGPLLVVAGAGSGKTATLASRVAWLIQQGVAPERILLLTFTRRAAAEMLTRAGRLTSEHASGRVWGGTFHSVANRLLRLHGRALGLPPGFTVLDQADAADLLNLIRGELRLGEGRRRFPQKATLAAIHSRMANGATPLSEVLQRHFPWVGDEADALRTLFREYRQRKRAQFVLDYDDLLLFWNALCRSGTVAAEQVAEQFEHILVDEYQDTNPIQAEILRAMRRGHPHITAVGDDAQAIYSFRAATIRNILDFPRHFPGTAVVKLEENYRSTPAILAASNAVMAAARERFTKELYSRRPDGARPRLVTCRDEPEQCDAVCESILAHREEGTSLREQAVLFRSGHHSDLLEVELARRNIPFVKYGGLRFLEAAHVKDLVALLRLLENPWDELSWYRVLQLLPGVGPAAARTLMASLGVLRSPHIEEDRAEPTPAPEGPAAQPAAPLPPLESPLVLLARHPPPAPSAAREELENLRAALLESAGIPLPPPGSPEPPPAGAEPPLGAQVERLLRFYQPLCARLYDNSPARLRDLEQLEQLAARAPSRAQFLSDLALDPPASTQDLAGPPLLDEDYLVLSTIHSAKGCEWDVVHLLHVADGMIPSDMATGDEEQLDEERRLLYVAMTRARNALHLYFPLRYYHRPRSHGDRHSYAQLTRFIPQGDLERHYEPVLFRGSPADAGTAPPAEEGVPQGSAAATVDALLEDLLEG
jgi:DNA helicase-2/ATP-dependent DNA helicase PcrA